LTPVACGGILLHVARGARSILLHAARRRAAGELPQLQNCKLPKETGFSGETQNDFFSKFSNFSQSQ
jgi:hypothetical protein